MIELEVQRVPGIDYRSGNNPTDVFPVSCDSFIHLIFCLICLFFVILASVLCIIEYLQLYFLTSVKMALLQSEREREVVLSESPLCK